jgi:hypothetical protein
VGVVEYSDRQYVEINLDDYYDTTSLREGIQLIKPSEGGTSRMGEVIKFVRENIFASGGRTGVPKVLVILTDGNDYSGDNPQAEAELIKKAGARVLGVAVGDRPNIASFSKVISPTENLYAVNQGSSLGRLIPSVARDILKTTKGKTYDIFQLDQFRMLNCEKSADETSLNTWAALAATIRQIERSQKWKV